MWRPYNISLLLLISSLTALFFDSSYIPIISVFHPALYLSYVYSCWKSTHRTVGWLLVSLCRAFPASDYFANGIPRTIAYVEALVIITALYGMVTIAMLVQCCIWEDHDRHTDAKATKTCNGREDSCTYPNEMTPLRAATSTLGSDSSDDEKQDAEDEGTSNLKPRNTSNVAKEHSRDSFLPSTSVTSESCTLVHHPSLSPLAFPTLFTTMYQIVFRFSPIGGASNPAMGLAQVNGLRQFVSIGGEISLVFWIGWLSSIIVGLGLVNSPSNTKKRDNRIPDMHLRIFGAFTLAMFVFGGVREKSGRGFYLDTVLQWPITRAQEAPLKVSCLTRTDITTTIDRTNERLAAGDDLIVWSEAVSQYVVSADMFEWDHGNIGAVIAATSYERIQGSSRGYNQVKMLQNRREIASYAKNRPVPIIESHVMQGSRPPHTTNVTFTPRLAACGESGGRGIPSQMGRSGNYCISGKLPRQDLYLKTTNAICFDVDFPYLLQQAHDADLAIVPSWYWASIGQSLWEHNILRAIENGFTLIKCSEYGISGAVDPYGRTIAALPTLDDEVYTFEVPVQKGVETLFENGGWMFGWICVSMSPLVLLLSVVGRCKCR